MENIDEKDLKEGEEIDPTLEDLKEGEPDPALEDDEEEVDYKALLEEETALRIQTEEDRDNYRTALLGKKGKLGKKEDDDSEPVTRGGLKSVVSEILAQQNVTAILNEVSTNPDEKALILQVYNTRIVHTGSDPVAVRRDLLSAKAVANQKTIFRKEKEIVVALKNKPGKGIGGGGGDEGASFKKDKNFTADQLAEFKKRGIDPEKVRANLVKGPSAARGRN